MSGVNLDRSRRTTRRTEVNSEIIGKYSIRIVEENGG